MANPRPTPKPGPGSKVTGVIPSEIQPERYNPCQFIFPRPGVAVQADREGPGILK